MKLQTPRLTLRYVIPTDWPALQGIWSDFKASPYACFDCPHPTDSPTVKARIACWAEASAGEDHLFFAVVLGEEVIGYVSLNRRETGFEIGYCFHSSYHGQGYAKEALLALIEEMKHRGVTCLSAGTALENTPSVALLTSVGFRQIATEKVSFYQDKDGRDIVFDGGIFEILL